MNIFDILGPVMVGPSSSHTAGAVRIGKISRLLLGEKLLMPIFISMVHLLLQALDMVQIKLLLPDFWVWIQTIQTFPTVLKLPKKKI
mgnify:CR=1 FL=1